MEARNTLPEKPNPQVNSDTAKMLADFAVGVYAPYKGVPAPIWPSSELGLWGMIKHPIEAVKQSIQSLETPPVPNLVGMSAWDALGSGTQSHGDPAERRMIYRDIAQKFVIKKNFSAVTGWAMTNKRYFGVIALKESEFDKVFREATGLDVTQTINFTTKLQFNSQWSQSRTHDMFDPEEHLWKKDKKREIVVAFRGTVAGHDWGRNANATKTELSDNSRFGGGLVHSGFQTIYTSCQQEITDNVFSLLPQEETLRKNTVLYITGHSLGAALATLCALHLQRNHRITPVVYTFASPRVGNKNFTDIFNSQIANQRNTIINSPCSLRFIRRNDAVVNAPPETLGYSHIQNLFLLDSGNEHNMIGYRQLVEDYIMHTYSSQKSSLPSTLFPYLESGLNYALADEPIILNGMKVIFDQTAPVYPVNLKRKDK